MATRLREARRQVLSSLHMKFVALAKLDANRLQPGADLVPLQQGLDTAKSDLISKWNAAIDAAAVVVPDLDAPAEFPGPSDGQVFAELPAEESFKFVGALLNVAQWEAQRRAVAAFTSTGYWPMKDGWWWYTWGTWALLVLQGGVTAGGVVLFAVPPSIERWTAVGVALTMLAATACVVLPAVSKDNQQRRQDAKNAFKQLEDSTQAALQLAEEVRALRMWRFWKVVFDLFVNMQMTVNKADGMLGA